MLSWKVIIFFAFIISIMEASPASVPSAALSFTAPPSAAGPTHLCVLAHGYVSKSCFASLEWNVCPLIKICVDTYRSAPQAI